MRSTPFRTPALIVACSGLLLQGLTAAPFTLIRVGDVDGFGFTSTAGLVAASGAAADTNGNNRLQQGEFLPSLNGNNSVAFNSGDNFDNRSAAEIGNTLVQGSGFTGAGATSGSKWTDISLSTTMPALNFPDPAGPGQPNEPLFQFRFDVAKTDISSSNALFFNLIFGDYDVTPASVRVTKNNGSGAAGAISTVALTTQPGNADGLIQAAFLNLSFFDVFSDAGAVWKGYLDVKFVAPNEPYTAFDYAELSLVQVSFTPTPDAGATAALLGLALALLVVGRRRN